MIRFVLIAVLAMAAVGCSSSTPAPSPEDEARKERLEARAVEETKSVAVIEERQKIGEEMAKTLLLTMRSKSVKNGEDVALTILILNTGPKTIAAFKGVATFRDVFGEAVVSANVTYDRPLPPRTPAEVRATFNVLTGIAEHNKLRDTPSDKLGFTFAPESIIFEDGTKLELPPLVGLAAIQNRKPLDTLRAEP